MTCFSLSVSVLQQSPISKLENIGKLLLDRGLNLHRTEELVEAMGVMLHQDTAESSLQIRTEAQSAAVIPERTGLLIDWLASIEPELIGSCTSLQVCIKFNNEEGKIFSHALSVMLSI